MKLSVIVSVYNDNHDGYLQACMDSLCNQTISDYEVIAVDDLSTDDSLEVLKEYEIKYPGKVRVIARETNGGPGAGKNTGLAAARGEWVTYVDHDDIISLDAYENLLRVAEEEGADLAGGRWQKMDDKGNPFEEPCDLMTFPGTCEINHEMRVGLIFKGERMWNKIIKKSVIDNCGFMLSEGTYIDDAPTTPFWMASCKKYAHYDGVVYYSREFMGSSSRSGMTVDRCNQHLLTQHRMIENVKKAGLFDELREALECRYFVRGYLRTARKVRKGGMTKAEIKEYYKVLHRDLKENASSWKTNPYLKERMTKREMQLAAMFMFSPKLYDVVLGITGR